MSKRILEFAEFHYNKSMNEQFNKDIQEFDVIKREIEEIIESDNQEEAIDESLTDSAIEYIKNVLRSKKAVSAQNKVNKVKYKAAAQEDDERREKMNDKASELQSIVDDRWAGTDEITKSALAKAKIEGGIKALEIQMQHTTAPSKIDKIEQALKNAEGRLKAAEEKIKEVKDKNEDEQKEVSDPKNKEEVKAAAEKEKNKEVKKEGEDNKGEGNDPKNKEEKN